MKRKVFLPFHAKSRVPGVWVDFDAPVLQNANDMKYCASLKAEQRKNGLVVINKLHEHPDFGRSLRAIVAQDARYKCRWRVGGDESNYSLDCFTLPAAVWYHELMGSN